MKNIKNASRGFTLIEILIVIGIIAILAAIVIVAINPAKQFAQARNTQRESNVNTILNAIGQRMADNKGVFEGSFEIDIDGDGTDEDFDCDELPSPEETITSANGSDALGNDSGNLGCLVPMYLPAIPTEPVPSGTAYTVELLDNGRVQVCAPEAADETSIPGAAAICVTR